LVPAEKLDILAALSTGGLDVAWGFFAWEGIQARLAGHALRHFFVAEHGIPSEYFPLLFTSATYIERARDTVQAFVAATARGYTYAIAHPDEAARIFLASVAPTDLPEHAPELVESSLEWLAPRFNGTLAGQPLTSPWGWQAADVWTNFATFIRDLARQHRLAAPEPEAETRGYTNEFIPR
jgi:ABC-type nitrate/sulfonate/bicarbonate transport system substrate-binding protein